MRHPVHAVCDPAAAHRKVPVRCRLLLEDWTAGVWGRRWQLGSRTGQGTFSPDAYSQQAFEYAAGWDAFDRLNPMRCPARLAHVLVQGIGMARCFCLILVIVSVPDSPPHGRAAPGLDGSRSSGPTSLVSVFMTSDERTAGATQSWAC